MCCMHGWAQAYDLTCLMTWSLINPANMSQAKTIRSKAQGKGPVSQLVESDAPSLDPKEREVLFKLALEQANIKETLKATNQDLFEVVSSLREWFSVRSGKNVGCVTNMCQPTLVGHISGGMEVRGVWTKPEQTANPNGQRQSFHIGSSSARGNDPPISDEVVSSEHCKQASGCWLSV